MNQTTLPSISIEDLNKAGVQFGHRRSKRHPKMAGFISGQKENIELIDLDSTRSKLEEAMQFLSDLVKRGGVVLFAGTKPHARSIVEAAAVKSAMPYVTERWIGGTLTNFQTVLKRLASLENLEKKISSKESEHYTKKELLELVKRKERIDRDLRGLRNMKKLPDALILATPKDDIIATREAKRQHIPVVAIIDTNMDPAIATHPVFGNDDAVSSLRFILDILAETIRNAKETQNAA